MNLSCLHAAPPPEKTLSFPTAFFNKLQRHLYGVRTHLLFLLILIGLSIGSRVAQATPFMPTSDDQVLERLRTKPLDAQTVALRQMRLELSRSPQNLPLATKLAQRYIEQGRITADPRYNGYAQAALLPWWNQAQPPIAVLVLRATIRQSIHDFDGAVTDLNQVLKLDPWNGQAWVTRALIHQVRGEYPAAKKDCARLLRISSELVTITCLSGSASLGGQAHQSYQLLQEVLTHVPSATTDEKLWAETSLAEIATRLGQQQNAEKYYKQALALGPDSYLLAAYADFLLDQKRPQEVVTLLKDQTRADGLLLRLALAEKMLPAPIKTHVTALQERFAASRQRGDTVHRREEAIFTLHLLDQPQAALTLAQANWQIQREPADTRILLEAALACHDSTAAKPVLTWLAQMHTEDVALQALQHQLGNKV